MPRRVFGHRLSRVFGAVAHPLRVLASVYGIHHRGQTDRIRNRLANLGFKLVRMREHTSQVDREAGGTRAAAGA